MHVNHNSCVYDSVKDAVNLESNARVKLYEYDHASHAEQRRGIQMFAPITAPDASMSPADSMAFIMSEYWIVPSPPTSYANTMDSSS